MTKYELSTSCRWCFLTWVQPHQQTGMPLEGLGVCKLGHSQSSLTSVGKLRSKLDWICNFPQKIDGNQLFSKKQNRYSTMKNIIKSNEYGNCQTSLKHITRNKHACRNTFILVFLQWSAVFRQTRQWLVKSLTNQVVDAATNSSCKYVENN